MTFFTFIVIIYVIYIICKKSDIENKYFELLSTTAAVEILNLASPFLKISSSTLNIQFILECILFIVSIKYLYSFKIKINFTLFVFLLLFYVICISGIVYEILCPYDLPIVNHTTNGSWDYLSLGLSHKTLIEISWGWTILCFYKLLFFLFQTMVFKSVEKAEITFKLLNNIIKIVYIDVYCGWFEYIARNILNQEYITYVYTMLVQGAYIKNTYRNDIIAICGLEKEPSHFVITLFILSICMLIFNEIELKTNKKARYGIYSFAPIIIIMILSGGFSSLWLLPMMVICRLCIKKRGQSILSKRVIKNLLVAAVLMLIVASFTSIFVEHSEYFQEKIFYVTAAVEFLQSGKLIYTANYVSSAFSRLVSIYDTISDFFNRPFWGLGVGIELCHSGLGNLLSQFGLLGAIVLYKIFTFSRYMRKPYDRMLLFVYVFIVNLPLDLYICPYSIFYVIIYENTSLYIIGKELKGEQI